MRLVCRGTHEIFSNHLYWIEAAKQKFPILHAHDRAARFWQDESKDESKNKCTQSHQAMYYYWCLQRVEQHLIAAISIGLTLDRNMTLLYDMKLQEDIFLSPPPGQDTEGNTECIVECTNSNLTIRPRHSTKHTIGLGENLRRIIKFYGTVEEAISFILGASSQEILHYTPPSVHLYTASDWPSEKIEFEPVNASTILSTTNTDETRYTAQMSTARIGMQTLFHSSNDLFGTSMQPYDKHNMDNCQRQQQQQQQDSNTVIVLSALDGAAKLHVGSPLFEFTTSECHSITVEISWFMRFNVQKLIADFLNREKMYGLFLPTYTSEPCNCNSAQSRNINQLLSVRHDTGPQFALSGECIYDQDTLNHCMNAYELMVEAKKCVQTRNALRAWCSFRLRYNRTGRCERLHAALMEAEDTEGSKEPKRKKQKLVSLYPSKKENYIFFISIWLANLHSFSLRKFFLEETKEIFSDLHFLASSSSFPLNTSMNIDTRSQSISIQKPLKNRGEFVPALHCPTFIIRRTVQEEYIGTLGATLYHATLKSASRVAEQNDRRIVLRKDLELVLAIKSR
jgi:hypothetical protein